MGTTDLSSAPPFQGNPNVSFTSTEEALAEQGAEGQAAPDGAIPVAVESGDTISGLMAQAGLDWNDPEDRAQFLADNPQFADASGGRNPDLIWPGEVLYLRPPGSAPAGSAESQATDQDAQELADAQSMSASTDSQVTHRENTVAAATEQLEHSIRAEIAAGGDPEEIRQRLKDDESLDLDDATIDAAVDAAQQPASRTNPVGGDAAESAPLSPAHDTNEAAANLSPGATGAEADAQRRTFVDAARTELEQGVSVEQLQARYGNDPMLNALIEQADAERQEAETLAQSAETTDAAAADLGQSHSQSVSTDAQATGRDNAISRQTIALEFAIRDELANGGDAAEIRQRLKDDPDVALDDAQIDAIVDAAQEPASPSNPVGGDATASAPFTPEYASNEAAQAWVDANALSVSTDSQATYRQERIDQAETDFIAAVREELARGGDVDAIKARYGNDEALNALIDEAAAG